MPRKDDLSKLITEHRRRLQQLEIQKAKLGINAPPEILIEMEDIEAEIERLQTELKALEGGGVHGKSQSVAVSAETTYAIDSTADRPNTSSVDFVQDLKEVVESEQNLQPTDDYNEIRKQQALILHALQEMSSEQAKQITEFNELRAWVQRAQEVGLPAHPELLAKLEALAKPTGSVEVGFPFILSVNYNVPLDKQGMIAIWKRLLERFRQALNKSAKGDMD
jgi:predicted  nucleic acid-binding Zn-ribbon protein